MKFDDILTGHLGEFGKYQKQQYALLCLTAIFSASQVLAPVFTAAEPTFSCFVNHTRDDGDSNATGTNNTTPDGCFFWTRNTINSSYPDEKMPCTTYQFDTSEMYSTIVTDWSLVCDQKYLSTVSSMVYMAGILVGSYIAGTLSDRIGRRKTLLIFLLMQGSFGVASAVAPEVYSYIVFRFITGAASVGTYLAAYVLGIELVGPSKRLHSAIIITSVFSSGYFVCSGLAFALRRWRGIQLAISVPSFVLVMFYYWLVRESPRWLISKGRLKDAENIVLHAFTVNNVVLPEGRLFTQVTKPVDEQQKKASILLVFKSRTLLLRTLALIFNWIAISMCYYGLSYNSGNLGGSIFVNLILSGIVEFPAQLVTFFCAKKRRKAPHIFGMFIGGAGCGCTLFLVFFAEDAKYNWLYIALNMVGKFGITMGFCIIYFWSAEVYPTVVRNSLIGVSSAFARVGSIAAPLIADAGKYVEGHAQTILAPLIFSAAAILGGLVAISLPETASDALPDTTEESGISDEQSESFLKTKSLFIKFIMAERRRCVNDPDSFCYICGLFTSKSQRKGITPLVKNVYHAYFGIKLGDQDRKWAPHIFCCTCYTNLTHGSKGKLSVLASTVHRNMKFDDILKTHLGEFGKYQKQQYALLCLPAICSALQVLAPVFTAAEPPFSCSVNHTNDSDNSNATHGHNTTADKRDACFTWMPSKINSSYPVEQTACLAFNFDDSEMYNTIVTEWALVCGQNYLSTVSSMVYMAGVLVGSYVAGILSDRFGRRNTILLCIIMQGCFGVASALAPEIYSYIAFRFITGAASTGAYLAAYVLAIELVGPSKRLHSAIIITSVFSSGYFVCSGIAYALRRWRAVQLAISAPSFVLAIVFYWLIRESPRWLISKGRLTEAENTLLYAFKVNTVVPPEGGLFPEVEEKVEEQQKKASILLVFKSRTLLTRTSALVFNWIALSTCYYGLSYNSGNLSGSIFLNLILSGIVEFPAQWTTFFSSKKRRKAPHIFGMLLGGAACGCTIFLVFFAEDAKYDWLYIALSMIGKFGITMGFTIIYFWSAEVYPTVLRNSLMGVSSAFARIGSIVAPLIADMGKYVDGRAQKILAPSIFSVMAILGGLVAISLPETATDALPDTAQESSSTAEKQRKDEDGDLQLTASNDGGRVELTKC